MNDIPVRLARLAGLAGVLGGLLAGCVAGPEAGPSAPHSVAILPSRMANAHNSSGAGTQTRP